MMLCGSRKPSFPRLLYQSKLYPLDEEKSNTQSDSNLTQVLSPQIIAHNFLAESGFITRMKLTVSK